MLQQQEDLKIFSAICLGWKQLKIHSGLTVQQETR
jgi:hypothetical protein